MIAHIQGTIQSKTLQAIVINVGGLGYRIYVPLRELATLGKIGDNVCMHIHTHVREDALILYGFKELDSLELFESIIQVNGIGPKLALTMLSGMTTNQLLGALTQSDYAALEQIPGIGKKTAQRLVLELKDRIKLSSNFQTTLDSGFDAITKDLRSAISNLGYKPKQIDNALTKIKSLIAQEKPLEDLLAATLKHI